MVNIWLTHDSAPEPTVYPLGLLTINASVALTGRNKPIDPAPYPNRLTAVDLNQTVLKHMATQLDFKLGEVLRQVTSNIPCSATSTYHLLLRKLDRYREGVVKGSRPGLPRSDTTLGLRRTPRTIATVQQVSRRLVPLLMTSS